MKGYPKPVQDHPDKSSTVTPPPHANSRGCPHFHPTRTRTRMDTPVCAAHRQTTEPSRKPPVGGVRTTMSEQTLSDPFASARATACRELMKCDPSSQALQGGWIERSTPTGGHSMRCEGLTTRSPWRWSWLEAAWPHPRTATGGTCWSQRHRSSTGRTPRRQRMPGQPAGPHAAGTATVQGRARQELHDSCDIDNGDLRRRERWRRWGAQQRAISHLQGGAVQSVSGVGR
jgi:hypothetical protein